MKITLEKIHYTKNILMHSLMYIQLTQQIQLRSSCLLGLQNPYLGPAIITRGFIFFAYRKLKLNYVKVFITFNPLILFLYLPHFNFELHQTYHRH